MDFSELSEPDQAGRLGQLAASALPLWDLAGAELSLIKIRENAVFQAVTPDGDRYVVRVHRPDYHTDAALDSELAWMEAVGRSGIPTPQVVPAVDRCLVKRVEFDGVPQPRQVDVLSWVDGVPLGSIEEGIEGDSKALDWSFRQIGTLAARLHNQAEAWRPPQGFTRAAFDVDGLTGNTPLWGRFWESRLLDAEERTLVLKGRERLRHDLAEFGTSSDRFGLIHADLLPENLLIAPDGTAYLIDFDDSAFGWHLFDLSTSLFFHLGEPHFDDALHALIEGYRAHRPLPEAHVALLPMFLVARGTTYLGWIHTRAESETARELGPELKLGVLELIESYLQQS